MTDQEYVGMMAQCKDLSQDIQQQMLAAMQKHSYKWWLSLDYRELAYYQLLEEDILSKVPSRTPPPQPFLTCLARGRWWDEC